MNMKLYSFVEPLEACCHYPVKRRAARVALLIRIFVVTNVYVLLLNALC